MIFGYLATHPILNSMKYLLLGNMLFFLFSVRLQAQEGAASPQKPGYRLVWADDFSGNGAPDHRFWSFEQGFERNKELQWYQADNARQEEGLLLIEGRRQSVKNPSFEEGNSDWKKNRPFARYTSSSIHTRGKFSFQYGLMEVRAKIDTAPGLWPAIWTLGVEGSWPANGEIDVMEYYLADGKPTILANAAWAHPEKRAAWDEAKIPLSEFLQQDPEWPDKFHVWKLDWSAEYIRIYLDDALINEVDVTATLNPNGTNPFQQPHYLLLNLAIGSNGGNPDSTAFPVTYQVDYVRIYQKE